MALTRFPVSSTIAGTVTANQGAPNTTTNAWSVKDDYQSGEVLADQTGAAAVLTFTFASAVQLVVVHANGLAVTDIARADPFGGTPTATFGIPCGDEAAMFMTVTTTVVRVFAPTGMVVTVWGFRRA